MSSSKFVDIFVTDYTDTSVVVRGDTKKYKEDLKKLGGKYNGLLKDGPGWIFYKKKEAEIKDFINKGVRLVTPEEEKIVAVEDQTRSKISQSQINTPTTVDLSNVMAMLNKLLVKVEKIEAYITANTQSTPKKSIIVPTKEEDSSSSDDDEEQEKKPPRRLLSRK
jgi:hypothetical protein